MKIVICTKKDLAACLALNNLLASLAGNHEIRVILSDYVLEEEKNNRYGSFLAAHERDIILEKVFPYLDAQFPNGTAAACKTYAGLQAYYDIPIELWGPIRAPQAVEAVQAIAPDMIISCRYDYIFPDAIISIPRLGIFGMHPGALPSYQGLCSPYRAMEHRDARSGCTLFMVDSGIDTGPVIDIGWFEIAYDKSVLWNFVHTYFAGIDTLMHHLPQLKNGKMPLAKPQECSKRKYFPYPTDDEFQAFLRKGGNIVLQQDYLEMLSWFLPYGLQDTHMPELEALISSSEWRFSTLSGREQPEHKLLHP